MRENGDYVLDSREIKHVYETMQLLSVMTQDHRFEEVYNDSVAGGLQNMCEVLDRIENKGREEGREEGLREGELKGKQETARNLHNMGMDNDFIAKALNISVELVKQWITTASA